MGITSLILKLVLVAEETYHRPLTPENIEKEFIRSE